MSNETMAPDEVLRTISRMGREAKAWREEAKKSGAVFSVSDDQDRQAEAAVAALIAEHHEDQGVIAVWRGRCERAEAERDALIAELERTK